MSSANGGERRTIEEDRIGEVLMTCVFHWRMRDVPDARIWEMEEELEGHLREAVERGRSVEEVVGDDFAAFAEEWAEEARSERSSLGWALRIGDTLVFGVVFGAAVYHLFRWSLSFQIETGMIVPIMLLVWLVVMFRTSGMAGEGSDDPRWKWWARALAITPLFFVPYAISWAITGELNAELFEWNWMYTLVALVASVVLGRLSKGSVGQK